MQAKIILLPGDGIGPEVEGAAVQVAEGIAGIYGHTFEFQEHPIGGNAIDRFGTALPDETLEACRQADAVLLGAVGGPKWDDPKAAVRPEQGLLGLRKGMELFANLRPVKPHPDLLLASPVKPERLRGVDLVVVRELTSGIYFGEPRLRRQVNGETQAVDTETYCESEISRVAHTAFRLAKKRRKKLTSVDKANVLECSRLWRQVVAEVSRDYPEVQYENVLVDAAAMFLITRPADFDVMLTSNLFGDILTDEASVLTGSMGNMPSASLGEHRNRWGYPRGLYEPIHGSAPDIAGLGIANPVGTIMSLAFLLRTSLGLEEEAGFLEEAVNTVISNGFRTRDLGGRSSTSQMTAAILEQLKVGSPA